MEINGEPSNKRPVLLEPKSYDQAQEILYDSVLRLWEVVDNLSRLRPSKSEYYSVSIFGSARLTPDDDIYRGVKWLAREIVDLGCHIVTGGGPGLMQAANAGAQEAAPNSPDRSVGIRIELEFEQETNPFVGQVYEHKSFFSRLHHFVLRSNAFVVVPGGIGTSLEMMMIWQLLQVRKLYDTPFVLVGSMWSDLVEWAERYMIDHKPQLAWPRDMTIPSCVGTVEEAFDLIRLDYARWQELP
jgi:uncharacterized protein (TIGR00730 family)